MMTGRRLVVVAGMALLTATTALAQNGAQMGGQGGAKNSLSEKLMANEHKVLEAVTHRDAAAFSALVMPGSWSVDNSGIMKSDDFVKAFSDVKVESVKALEMRVITIDANAALVVYKLDQKGSFKGMAWPPVVYASTVWANHGGTWHAVFHQESAADKP